jgi:hypothetical protein
MSSRWDTERRTLVYRPLGLMRASSDSARGRQHEIFMKNKAVDQAWLGWA